MRTNLANPTLTIRIGFFRIWYLDGHRFVVLRSLFVQCRSPQDTECVYSSIGYLNWLDAEQRSVPL
ncbi:hypothetical protein KR51_00037720 [Rubidibacter lacunae KORDI 51-2]|uniref:Uncharacterized protein n=1 Tax=Rubidibacter lacunae KORDI 51-2 TaxID=582515 RepID=U5DGV8_9CHRO|nr:hypothetical protein KR51_00037720 [Rubidibacter lacunae KORDI 51-2]